jgi:hypothetical protein
MSSFGEVLAEFKRLETPESVFPLLEDKALCDALMAWRSVKVTYKTASDCGETVEQAKWDWLWNQVEYEQKDFSVVAGCKAQEAPGMLTRLRGLRLIYPDGSINNFARQYLGSLIIQKIQGKKKSASAPASITSESK